MAKKQGIDRNKLREALRRLGDESVFSMLDDAIEHLPAKKLEEIAGRYMNLEPLRVAPSERKRLLARVQTFDAASRAGRYYEGFDVNSKNYMTKSPKTRAFIADCNRLLDQCVEQAPSGDPSQIRGAIEQILALLRTIDEGRDDIVFFADEGGAWQVGVDWGQVLPALFVCMAQTSEPDEYARGVVRVIDEFDESRRKQHLAAARQLGTAAQRKALRYAGDR